jgi:hypothetical protein
MIGNSRIVSLKLETTSVLLGAILINSQVSLGLCTLQAEGAKVVRL